MHVHDSQWGAVSAREDVDGSTPTVIYTPNRCDTIHTEIEMEPKEARRLARALIKAAKRLES